MQDVPIKNAATVILLRDGAEGPSVLMGQRGRKAVFMPNKFVFPGGAMDDGDASVPLKRLPPEACMARLRNGSDDTTARGLLAAAVREVWEETGHALAVPDASAPALADEQPEAWRPFFAEGLMPDTGGLNFVFRAITPPGRPRRFDARFFLGRADALDLDWDDFSRAQDELAHLQWVPLAKTRDFDLPFITEVVLAEVQNRIENPGEDHPVPFFSHDGERSQFVKL